MVVSDVGLCDKSDIELWRYAKKHHYTIVTFDVDFYDFANLYGHPPKVIWLQTGNTSTNKLAILLNNKVEEIRSFVEDKNYQNMACLELSI